MADQVKAQEILLQIQGARTLIEQDHYLQAEKLLRHLLPIVENEFGDQSSELADVCEIYAFTCHDLARINKDQYAEWIRLAILSYKRTVSIRETLGPLDMALSGNYSTLGALHYRVQQYQEALACYKKELAIAEAASLDLDGSNRLHAWNHVAGALISLGRLDEAEELLKKALSILDLESPDTSFILETLAEVYEARAKELRDRAQILGKDRC